MFFMKELYSKYKYNKNELEHVKTLIKCEKYMISLNSDYDKKMNRQ